MLVYTIGRILDIQNKVRRYRLIDREDNDKMMDVPEQEIVKAIKNNKITIENMAVKNNSLVGINLNLDKLPTIIINQLGVECTNPDEYNKMTILKVHKGVEQDYCQPYMSYMTSTINGDIQFIANGAIINEGLIQYICNKENINIWLNKNVVLDNIDLSEDNTFDTRNYPYVTVINDDCFTYRNTMDDLNTLIIGDNIVKIGNNIISECFNVKNIIVLGNPDIARNAFKMSSNRELYLTFFVLRDSKIHKYCIKNKYHYIIIDDIKDKSYQEIIATNKQVTSKDKQNKYKFILEGTENEDLVNSNNIESVEFLYNLNLQLFSNDAPRLNVNNYKLNTSKFKSINLRQCWGNYANYIEHTIIRYKHNSTNNIVNKYHSEDTLELVFINVCNLITTLLDNDEQLYSDEFILNTNYNYTGDINENNIEFGCIVASNNKYIIYTQIQVNEILRHPELGFSAQSIEYMPFYVIMVTIGENIVFQTPINVLMLRQFLASDYNSLFEINTVGVSEAIFKHNNYIKPLTNWLHTNDIFGNTLLNNEFKIVLSGVTLTKEQSNIMYHMFRRCNIIIGFITDDEDYKQGKQDKKANVLFYSITESKFVECYTIIDNMMDPDNFEGEYKYIKIKNIYDLSEINKINKKYFNIWDTAINYGQNKTIARLLTSKIKSYSEYDISNYDIDIQKQMCMIADYFYKQGIEHANKLTFEGALLLQKCGLLKKEKVTFDTIKNHQQWKCISTSNEENELDVYFADRAYNIASKELYKKRAISEFDGYFIISFVLNKKTRKSIVFKSFVDISRLINALYLIGQHRAFSKDIALNKIDNDNISDVNNYYFYYIAYWHTLSHGASLKLWLCIDKNNCDLYIISDYYDTDFYKIFRLKSIDIVYDKFHNNFPVIGAIAERLQMKIYHDANSELVARLYNLRDNIINGLPNNYDYIGDGVDFYKYFAKQPKE